MKTKTGRKQIHHVAANGKTIEGLSRRPSDGRWRIIGTQTTFTEANEERAIEKFYRLTQQGPTLAQKRMMEKPNPFAPTPREMFEWVAEQIKTQPFHAAQMMGIEQIGYLDQLQPPQPLPSLEELGQLYQDKANVQSAERRKIKAAWKDFRETTGIQSLKDINSDIAVAFRESVASRELSGKTQSLLFNRVRRVLTFAAFHNKAKSACDAALKALEIMTVDDASTTEEANPISVGDWQKLYAAATGDDLAMILLGLNCGCYLQEIVDLEWSNIKAGWLEARRKKKGKHLRVSTLWAETIAALDALPRKINHLFVSESGLPLTVSGAGKRFRKLRKAAGLPTLEANQLRDGASQAATEAGIEQRYINMMMGWKNPGVSDKYVLRNPKMVKPACDATYKKYFGGAA